ncbi:hypothetical protein NEIFLAOT_01277 [Neisseria flavescens NRL30031/H210]|uniref:Uncharacterized protein n=1 Tax=Neisseria flavescens NRL30031/H210 TaxID=546264 RepID=C0EMV0_NEIFL|nr:hypothetical protein NEIFLAOT_01277 [Neisseria flavescens NRL30031/H210]
MKQYFFNFYRQVATGRLKNFRRQIKHYLSLKSKVFSNVRRI